MRVDTRLTYDDLAAIPYDGRRHEIINGEHFVTTSLQRRHNATLQNLSFALDSFLRKAKLGRAFGCPVDVVLSEYDVVEPDILVLLNDQLQQYNEKNVQGAPNIVVEVLSESTARRDCGDKLKLYAKHQVLEYWLVDTDQKSIQIHCFHKPDQPVTVLRESDVLTSCLLPNFQLAVSSLFEPL